MIKNLVLVGSLLVATSGLTQQTQSAHFDGKTWWDYVKVLADDNMEGRETGSPGLQRAEAYVVDQLKQSGVQPAGADGYYQRVKFQSRQIVEKDSIAALVRNGKVEPLTLGEDGFFSTRVDLAPEVEAPLVFAGYGLSVPEKNYDDFSELELKNKVVVILSGSPADIPGPLASHYQSIAERWKVLHRAGALGVITIMNPAVMDVPWSRMSVNRAHPNMVLADPQFDESAGEKLAMVFNPAKADKLFEGSGHTFDEILSVAKDRKQLPRFPLAASIRTKAKVEKHDVESANIIAKLAGSDPELKKEYVVLSAHIDHIGIGEPINGDRIYNGAMDNGSGSALLLDMASSLKKSPENLKRSVLFVFVTAEEKGLLGSRYFAAKPTVDEKSMVADINVDMFLPIIPLKLLTIFGLAESDLGDAARDVARAQGITVQADPEPQRNLFIRSDQYNFIRRGIPALAMNVGVTPGSPEVAIFKDWLTQRYHAPSDDLNQPIDLSTAAKYEEIVRGLLVSVANNPQKPQWKQDSFFRRYSSN